MNLSSPFRAVFSDTEERGRIFQVTRRRQKRRYDPPQPRLSSGECVTKNDGFFPARSGRMRQISRSRSAMSSPRKRLIHQKHRTLRRQRARQRHPLLHPARKLFGKLTCRVGQLDRLQKAVCRPRTVPTVRQNTADIVPCREPRQKDAAPERHKKRRAWAGAPRMSPASGPLQSRDHAQDCGLSHTGRPAQRRDLPRLQGQVQITEHRFSCRRSGTRPQIQYHACAHFPPFAVRWRTAALSAVSSVRLSKNDRHRPRIKIHGFQIQLGAVQIQTHRISGDAQHLRRHACLPRQSHRRHTGGQEGGTHGGQIQIP